VFIGHLDIFHKVTCQVFLPNFLKIQGQVSFWFSVLLFEMGYFAQLASNHVPLPPT
jgi:hypothetical protein